MLCELAIIACDLAEVLGTAIALQLLFGLPLIVGVCLTALDVLLILALQRYGFRKLEALIVALLLLIAGCFLFELLLSRPSIAAIAGGLIPTTCIVTDPMMLYLAVLSVADPLAPDPRLQNPVFVQQLIDQIRQARMFAFIGMSVSDFVNVVQSAGVKINASIASNEAIANAATN